MCKSIQSVDTEYAESVLFTAEELQHTLNGMLAENWF